MKINKLLVGSLIGMLPIAPQIVIGEETSRVMEEVIVTSRRKNESVQDVPLSVTVFGEEKIAQLKPNTQALKFKDPLWQVMHSSLSVTA